MTEGPTVTPWLEARAAHGVPQHEPHTRPGHRVLVPCVTVPSSTSRAGHSSRPARRAGPRGSVVTCRKELLSSKGNK